MRVCVQLSKSFFFFWKQHKDDAPSLGFFGNEIFMQFLHIYIYANEKHYGFIMAACPPICLFECLFSSSAEPQWTKFGGMILKYLQTDSLTSSPSAPLYPIAGTTQCSRVRLLPSLFIFCEFSAKTHNVYQLWDASAIYCLINLQNRFIVLHIFGSNILFEHPIP